MCSCGTARRIGADDNKGSRMRGDFNENADHDGGHPRVSRIHIYCRIRKQTRKVKLKEKGWLTFKAIPFSQHNTVLLLLILIYLRLRRYPVAALVFNFLNLASRSYMHAVSSDHSGRRVFQVNIVSFNRPCREYLRFY